MAFKQELDVATQQKLATEDRVQHLDGALKEVMKQLRSGREEQEQRIHETIVKKTQENDKLRAEMEAKLAEASHVVAQTRAELLESRAENKALSLALQVPSLHNLLVAISSFIFGAILSQPTKFGYLVILVDSLF